MRMTRMRISIALSLVLAACSSDGESSPDGSPDAAPFSVSTPTQVAGANYDVKDIVADRDAVYWIASSDSALAYEVHRFDLQARHDQILTDGHVQATELAQDDTALYWVELDTGTIRTIAKSGGVARTLVPNLSGAITVAVDGDRIYWVESAGVRSARKSDGGDVQHLDDMTSQVDEIDADPARARLLFIAGDGVQSIPEAGGVRTKIGNASMGDLAIGATRLAFTPWKTGGLVVADLDGGHPQTFFAGAYEGRVAIDGDTIYWTDVMTTPGEAGVHRLAPTDGAPVTIATIEPPAIGVAVTPGAVFYGVVGQLWAAPR